METKNASKTWSGEARWKNVRLKEVGNGQWASSTLPKNMCVLGKCLAEDYAIDCNVMISCASQDCFDEVYLYALKLRVVTQWFMEDIGDFEGPEVTKFFAKNDGF